MTCSKRNKVLDSVVYEVEDSQLFIIAVHLSTKERDTELQQLSLHDCVPNNCISSCCGKAELCCNSSFKNMYRYFNISSDRVFVFS